MAKTKSKKYVQEFQKEASSEEEEETMNTRDSESEEEGSEKVSGSEQSGSEMEESEDEETQRTAIRQELSTLSFAELESLKTKIGTKEWNEAMFGSSSKAAAVTTKKKRLKEYKRDTKNRPRELSSKIRVKRVREDVQVKRKKTRDPRFENLCGDYDEKIWSKNYDFIDEIRKNEQQDLKNKLKDEKDEEKRAEIRTTLQKLLNKERSDAVKKEKDEKQRKEREENIQRLKEGKKPYYMKKSTKKIVELADKYEQLKSSGKLDGYLKKKRTRNAVRDKKGLPSVSNEFST